MNATCADDSNETNSNEFHSFFLLISIFIAVVPFLVSSYIQEIQQNHLEAFVYEPYQSATNFVAKDCAFLEEERQARQDHRRGWYSNR